MAVAPSSSPEKELAPPKETHPPTIPKREEHTSGFPTKKHPAPSSFRAICRTDGMDGWDGMDGRHRS